MAQSQLRLKASAPSSGRVCARPARRTSVAPAALFGKKAAVAVKEPETKTKAKQSVLSQTLNAFDFTSTRSEKDADLLYEAKYGKRGEDGRMTPEQYQALRRKVIGTSKDFFKSWVEEDQVKNIKTYYKPTEAAGTVPYLPFLVGVIVAMLATTVLVVVKTSA